MLIVLSMFNYKLKNVKIKNEIRFIFDQRFSSD